MSYRYPNCDDYRNHQDEARRDASYGGHLHRPSPWDEPDCRRAYDDEYRRQELLREDPESLWRDRPRPFNADVIEAALDNYELVPQADPNVPSHMVRMAKAEAAKQLVMASPELWDVKSAIEWYCDQLGIPDLKRFFVGQQPQQQAPDPNVIRANTMLQSAQLKAQDGDKNRQFKLIELGQKARDTAAELASKENIAKLQMARELAIHPLSAGIVASQQPNLNGSQGPPQ